MKKAQNKVDNAVSLFEARSVMKLKFYFLLFIAFIKMLFINNKTASEQVKVVNEKLLLSCLIIINVFLNNCNKIIY